MRQTLTQNSWGRQAAALCAALALLGAAALPGQTTTAHKKKAAHKHATRRGKARTPAQKAHLRQAFVASTELRPMAQQLATFRSPEAYAGVEHYAQTHTGEAAAAAYLALGHAYFLDKRSDEAAHALLLADQNTQELNDYAEYMEALAYE